MSDPVLTILLHSANSENVTQLFLSLFALFERTLVTTTYLTLWIDYEEDNGTEVFLPLVDSFRFFINLETLVIPIHPPPHFYNMLLHQV
jgi:hypothetical protein